MLAERVEKNVLGMELAGANLRRDVAQVSVGFRNHRLVDVAGSEDETRRLLKRRAFDHLLTLALARIAETRSGRVDLARQRDVLRHKLATLEQGGWSFSGAAAEPPSPASLQAELAEIDARLREMGPAEGELERSLDLVAELLRDSARQLWIETLAMRLDSMNIARTAQDADARDVVLPELHSASGRRNVLTLIVLDPAELPPPENRLDTAYRYL